MNYALFVFFAILAAMEAAPRQPTTPSPLKHEPRITKQDDCNGPHQKWYPKLKGFIYCNSQETNWFIPKPPPGCGCEKGYLMDNKNKCVQAGENCQMNKPS
ncbi:hypothetical protein TELCIR_16134 [Teladorsagia circumcincta]|uniref:Kunitz/Bovine pancreatic trypsin inhibitor domain protein n=1 Tax=Teladorsagia circumcincta TaxID=45464 RepID=A0A2G9TWG9_TELCI|nr:hypothetical protein TELCIR_16134 [Teladorsagia circumcincta]